jgi:hypothetical protein
MLMILVITVGFLVVVARNSNKAISEANTEECPQSRGDGMDEKVQSEFLLESLTRNLLGR